MAEGASASNSEYAGQLAAAAREGNERELCRILDEGADAPGDRTGAGPAASDGRG